MDVPANELVSSDDITKKGKRDGMTVRMHRSTPAAAALMAVLESSISSPMAAAHNADVYVLVFSIQITPDHILGRIYATGSKIITDLS